MQNNRRLSEIEPKLVNKSLKDNIDRSCPICLELFDVDHCREALTSCGHSFCETCLHRTLQLKPFCPLCRRYQKQDKSSDQDSEQAELDESTPWNPQVVRAFFGDERIDQNGQRMRTVHLTHGQATNIHISRGAKINISPNSNIIINGKRIQNPSDCNQQ